jgi:hypothetical protein
LLAGFFGVAMIFVSLLTHCVLSRSARA